MISKEAERRLTLPPPPKSIADAVYLKEISIFFLEAEGSLSPARKDSILLLGPMEGALSLIMDDSTVRCSAGQAVLLLPETSAAICAAEDSILVSVALQGDLAERLLWEISESGLLFAQAAALSETANALFSMEDVCGAAPDGAAASAAAFSLLMSLYGHSSQFGESGYPPLVSAAISMMREEFATIYGIEELSDRLHVTKNHLIRAFTAAVGISPGKYLTNLRIEYAKLVLRSGESSLEAVAAACGFSGADYFGKVFRRETGMTPRSYTLAHTPVPAISIDSIYV